MEFTRECFVEDRPERASSEGGEGWGPRGVPLGPLDVPWQVALHCTGSGMPDDTAGASRPGGRSSKNVK